MSVTRFTLAFIALAGLAGCGGSNDSSDPAPPEPPRPAYPETRSGTDSDVYFGRAVADPYRWLEDIESTETDNWVRAQNQLTDRHIAAMPDYAALSKRIADWFVPEPTSAKRHGVQGQEQLRVEGVQGKDGKYYYQIQKQQRRQDLMRPGPIPDDFLSVDNTIYVADSADDVGQGTKLVDADMFRIDPDDYIQLMGHKVSDDGKFLAYAMVRNFADLAEVHVVDLQQPEYGPFLKVANVYGGTFVLHEQGVFYSTPRHTANPHVSPHTYQTLYHHPFGQDAEALLEGEQYDQLGPAAIHDGYLYYELSTGMQSSLGRIDLARPLDSAELILDGRAHNKVFNMLGPSEQDPGKLLVATTQGAALNRLIEVDPGDPAPENWREILPNSPPGVTEYINTIEACGADYYAEQLVQGSSKLFHYGSGGKREIALPGEGSILNMECAEDNGRTLLSYYYSSLVQPFVQYRYDPATHTVTQGPVSTYKGYDPSQYEMRRLTATSKDGTQFPIYIAHKKGLQPTGDAPAMLYVYGGFSVPILPTFQEKLIPLLESGGIYAIAQVRGGAEFGTAWHDAGRLFNKQNTYDDIAAAATHLVEAGLTQPGKLALQGESNGGLSTAVMGLQRPDLFAVVFPTVGVLDLVRYDLFTSGFGWHADYGQVARQAEFENLMKFSPLHNVKPQPYLPTYVFTGKTDGRVMPAHSYKYAATLQNTATGNHPYMLYAFPKDGHSLTRNWQYYLTYMWTAFFHHTGSHYTKLQ